ncbi:hypothetical protein [Pontiella sulfatireligans]|uniref:Uncharacterized protein n=1 Tax=Pontiella sulfatireligans TaxID=2750658 RepID=A0A6C2UKJ2_9BACT|nr:hypothetical protein [Pontiella sulfatireligans]VGO19921.1 hypothetical protein SCARR_01981 [Pontiella sulfatireligans]
MKTLKFTGSLSEIERALYLSHQTQLAEVGRHPFTPDWTRTILATLLVFSLTATVQGEDYTYTTNSGAITITNYTGSGGAVAIPDTTHNTESEGFYRIEVELK